MDPQHLREHVDKYCEGIMDYLKTKESLNKRLSPINLIQRGDEIDFLLAEASHNKVSLTVELHTIRLRVADLQTKLAN